MKRLAFCLFTASLLLCSCASYKKGEVPPPPSWVLSNPVETKDSFYAVGGPHRTVQQSDLEAKAKISATINTVAASVSQSSTSITSSIVNDEASREKETSYSSEMASASNTVYSTGTEIARWQDPTTGMWWVLYEAKKVILGK